MTKKMYACNDCGEYFDGEHLWVCEDDKLRCGACVDAILSRVPWGEEKFSACHDHVEGRIGAGR